MPHPRREAKTSQHVLSMRLTDDEHVAANAAAGARGMPLAAFARAVLAEASRTDLIPRQAVWAVVEKAASRQPRVPVLHLVETLEAQGLTRRAIHAALVALDAEGRGRLIVHAIADQMPRAQRALLVPTADGRLAVFFDIV